MLSCLKDSTSIEGFVFRYFSMAEVEKTRRKKKNVDVFKEIKLERDKREMTEKGEKTDEQVAYVDSSRNIAVAMGEEDLKTLLTKQKKFSSS